MAKCIADLTKNASEGKDLMEGTDSYNKSKEVSTKIYIPYGIYTGEGK
jgi:methyl-galactoside transport system substrate-binding protein